MEVNQKAKALIEDSAASNGFEANPSRSILDGLDSLFDAAKDIEFDPYNGINLMRNHALALGALGFKVFPVFHMEPGPNGEPECSCCKGQRYFAKKGSSADLVVIKCWNKPGKHPRCKWKETATSDADEIRDLWNRKRGANIGIATGQPSGVFVIDLDGKVGMDSLRALEAEHGKLPDTMMAFSGRGDGLHLYFKAPAEEEGLTISAGTIGRGIDTRGTGGYIIGPGSNHESLRRYMWVPNYGPGEIELAELPAWFVDAMKAASNKTAAQKASGKAKKKATKQASESSPDDYDARFDVFDVAAKDMASRGWEIGDDGELLLGVDAYLSRIGEESKGKHGFHSPIYSALCSFFFHEGLEATDDEAKAVLVPAIKNAPCDDGRNLSRYATDRYLDQRIADAREFIGMAKKQEAERIQSEYERLKGLIEGFSDFTDQKTVDRACEKLALLKLPPKLRAGLVKALAKKIGTTEAKLTTKLGKLTEARKKEVLKERKERERQEQNAAAASDMDNDVTVTLDVKKDGMSFMVAAATLALDKDNKRKKLHYNRGTAMARLIGDPENPGYKIVQLLDAGKLKHALQKNDFLTWMNDERDVAPDKDVIDLIYNSPTHIFPKFSGFAYAPFYTKSGELVMEPGYHEGTGIYYQPKEGFELTEEMQATIKAPTKEDAIKARDDIFKNVLQDFPFCDGELGDGGKTSIAHAFAMLLQPFMREMIEGQTPFYLYQKPVWGTGASLLIDMLVYIALGGPVPTDSLKGNDEEMRKAITSAQVAGRSVFLIDNIRRYVDHESLCNLGTAAVWSDRVLQRTEMVSIRNVMMTILGGNNVRMSKEMGRRCVGIGLKTEGDPTDRVGFFRELETWVPEHRAELVAAVLTIISYWISIGQPKFSGKVRPSFGGWSRSIGGVLQAVEIEGFLENMTLTDEAAETEDDAWPGFLADLFDSLPKESRTEKEIKAGLPEITKPLRLVESFNVPTGIGKEVKCYTNLMEFVVDRQHTIGMKGEDTTAQFSSLGGLMSRRKGRPFKCHDGRTFRIEASGRVLGDNKQAWQIVKVPPADAFAVAAGLIFKSAPDEADESEADWLTQELVDEMEIVKEFD